MRIYQCEKCKKFIFTNEELNCEGWVELIAGTVEASKEKHIPVVTKKCKQVKVDVGSLVGNDDYGNVDPLVNLFGKVDLIVDHHLTVFTLDPDELLPVVCYTLVESEPHVVVEV